MYNRHKTLSAEYEWNQTEAIHVDVAKPHDTFLCKQLQN
jgi:hypothetical protein